MTTGKTALIPKPRLSSSRWVRKSGIAVVLLIALQASAAEPSSDGVLSPSNTSEIRIDREVGAAQKFALEMGQNRLLVLSEAIVRVSVAPIPRSRI